MHTIHNLPHLCLKKTKLEHDFLKEGPLNIVVGLAHIELGHEAFVGIVLSAIEVVDNLMSNEVVMDHAPRYKGALVVADAVRKEDF